MRRSVLKLDNHSANNNVIISPGIVQTDLDVDIDGVILQARCSNFKKTIYCEKPIGKSIFELTENTDFCLYALSIFEFTRIHFNEGSPLGRAVTTLDLPSGLIAPCGASPKEGKIVINSNNISIFSYVA